MGGNWCCATWSATHAHAHQPPRDQPTATPLTTTPSPHRNFSGDPAAASSPGAAAAAAAITIPDVPLPEEPCLQLRGRAGLPPAHSHAASHHHPAGLALAAPHPHDRIKTFSISLHGLLDYDDSDRDEPTFELSVFAECFTDMLSREFGGAVYGALAAEAAGCVARRGREGCGLWAVGCGAGAWKAEAGCREEV